MDWEQLELAGSLYQMQNLKISNAPQKDLMLVEDFILKKSPGDPVEKSWSLIVEFGIDRESLLKEKVRQLGTCQMQLLLSQDLVSWEMDILGEYLTPCYLLPGLYESTTNLHNTVITTAQGRTEKGADVCYLEAEETHTEDLELEMLTCDADQVHKGCASPLNAKDSRKLGTYHSWHQYRAIFWVKGSMLQTKFGVVISNKKKGECIHLTFVAWDY